MACVLGRSSVDKPPHGARPRRRAVQIAWPRRDSCGQPRAASSAGTVRACSTGLTALAPACTRRLDISYPDLRNQMACSVLIVLATESCRSSDPLDGQPVPPKPPRCVASSGVAVSRTTHCQSSGLRNQSTRISGRQPPHGRQGCGRRNEAGELGVEPDEPTAARRSRAERRPQAGHMISRPCPRAIRRSAQRTAYSSSLAVAAT